MSINKKIKNKINKLTYDKVKFNSKVAIMKKSFEEVNKLINGNKKDK
jgi:hypothetical protein